MRKLILKGNNKISGSFTPSGSTKGSLLALLASLSNPYGASISNVSTSHRISTFVKMLKNLGVELDLYEDRIDLSTDSLNSSDLKHFPFLYDYFLLLPFLVNKRGKASLPHFKKSDFNSTLELLEKFGIKASFKRSPEKHVEFYKTAFDLPQDLKPKNLLDFYLSIVLILSSRKKANIIKPFKTPATDLLVDIAKMSGFKVVDSLDGLSFDPIDNISPIVCSVPVSSKETVYYSLAALLTNGFVNITPIDKPYILSYLNLLSKIGVKYDSEIDSLLFRHLNINFDPLKISTALEVGLLYEWQPYLTLLATKCTGESTIIENVLLDGFDYVRNLNMLGAGIKLYTFEDAKLPNTHLHKDDLSSNSYTVAKVVGPVILKSNNIIVDEPKYLDLFILAGIIAEGDTTLSLNFDLDEDSTRLLNNLTNLGAKIYYE
jgi:UDP-N-acetylglucosamine enolpyruvyl transferase